MPNPVLQYELISNLRRSRGFVLLAAYVGLLGLLVYAAWPAEQTVDMVQSEQAQPLVNLFFLGQYLLVSLLAPSFAAGAIAGEKERGSFEMLLASPLQPGAIVLGKLAASLTPLAELMLCALPMVMLCLPLGGVSPYEVLAVYAAMFCSVALFGMLSLWCSSYFLRTSAALVVSYLLILPLALLGVLLWLAMEQLGLARLVVVLTIFPLVSLSLGALCWVDICRRLLRGPDLGTAGKQIIDPHTEAREAVGLYLDCQQFPDRLFAPPPRKRLLPDGANPIYDKEIRSEIFGQGTLMLRLVIQISMLVALPLMALCLFLRQHLAPWYLAYVLLFNMLVGPVFSAGSVTSERERQTLDLLLTTLITPWQMLWGKLLAGLRISGVLTSFLMWPVLLACIMPLDYWNNLPTMLGYFLVVALTGCTTATTGLFCSTLFHKSASSLLATYLILSVLFLGPVAAQVFCETFWPHTAQLAGLTGICSPFAAVFRFPLEVSDGINPAALTTAATGSGKAWGGFLGFTVVYNLTLLLCLLGLFRVRWRVAR